MANIKKIQDAARAYIADAAIAVVVALIVALILGSLSAAGVITMALAKFLLFLAWIVGFGGSFLGGQVWQPKTTHRIVFLTILAVLLSGVYCYEAAHQPDADVQLSGPSLDDEISVNCDPSMPPTAFNENKNIYVFELGAPPGYDGFPAPVAGAQTSFILGSGPISWTSKPGMGSFSKCTISNYSDVALIDVFVKMPVFYSPILATKAQYTGGKPFGDRYVFSPLLNLGPSSGTNSTADFYIWNATDYFTQAEIPATIQLSVAGSLERRTVKLIPAAFPGYAVMQPDVLPASIKGPPN